MKLKLKSLSLLLAGVAIVYTACKKSSNSPSTSDPSITPDVVAGQVASTINQSLFGGLGAFDVSGGLSAPSTIGARSSRTSGGLTGVPAFNQPLNAKINTTFATVSPITCGVAIDTALSISLSSSDTSATIAGSFKFNYTCSNSQVTGFTTNDNITIGFNSSTFDISYKVGEILTLLTADPNNPGADVTINGSLNSSGSYQFKTGTKRSGTSVFNYTLTSLVISPDLGDAVSGSATFNTSGTGPKGVWNCQGTIVFLGNHFATVTINGKAYHVNLQTGAVG